MKKLLSTTILSLFASQPFIATANDHWYGGVIYTIQKTKPMSGRNFDTAGILLGYQYNEYFDIEARFSGGISGYSNNWSDANLTEYKSSEDVDVQSSIFVKTSYPLLDSLSIYALTGYTNCIN